jgi:hypothetical protein
MKQNYHVGQRLMAYILLFGLLLQSCNSPYPSIDPSKQEPIKPSTSIPKQGFPSATANPAELKEHADKDDGLAIGENELRVNPNSSLEENLATPKSLAAKRLDADLTKEQDVAKKQGFFSGNPSQLTQAPPRLLSNQKTKSKPVAESLQAPKLVHERQQYLKASSTPLIVEQTPQQDNQAGEKAPMLTKGRFQMAFEKTTSGQWKALVNESFQVGISRKLEWPVFFELGYNISHVANSHLVHVVYQDGESFIWVGTVGKNCLVPNNYGYIRKDDIRDKDQIKRLWDNYYINAPEQHRKPAEKYSYLKTI